MWVGIMQIRARIEQKAEEGGIHSLFLPHCLSWNISSHLLLPWDLDLHCQQPCSQALGLGMNYTISFSGSPLSR